MYINQICIYMFFPKEEHFNNAQALFVAPDLLLLDEPTNHLDVHAVTWLEEFLKNWEKTVLIVSHDRCFLCHTTTHTIFLHKKRLFYYGGNYDTFLRVRAENRANTEATKSIQDRKVMVPPRGLSTPRALNVRKRRKV